MKKVFLFTFLSLFTVYGWCQISSLSQNFDGVCATSTSIPMSWSVYTPYHLLTSPQGAWSCAAIHGKGGSGGMQCTDTFSNADHLDTSFLLTPLLNLSSYSPGHVYLQFDSKTTNIHLGGNLSVLHTLDSISPSTGSTDLTPGMMPVFTNRDSTDWNTHVVDLSSFEATPSFYIAFMFTSTATTGSIWFLDNVMITTHNITLNDPELSKDELKMVVLGRSTPNHIDISLETNAKGDYMLSLTDMTGRIIHQQQINVQSDISSFQISGLNISSGMYILKIGNKQSYSYGKVVIQ